MYWSQLKMADEESMVKFSEGAFTPWKSNTRYKSELDLLLD